MKVKFIYVNTAQTPYQRGHIVSVRVQNDASLSAVQACGIPVALWNENLIGKAACCGVTKWIDMDNPEETLSAIFERGEMTVNEDGELCNTQDSGRSALYAESGASNG